MPDVAGRQYSERELQALRESDPPFVGKLALHEILAEKLMGLERMALKATGGLPDLPTPSLSRLPSLQAVLDRLQHLHLQSSRGRPPSSTTKDAKDQQRAAALAELQRECAALRERAERAEARATAAEAAVEAAESAHSKAGADAETEALRIALAVAAVEAERDEALAQQTEIATVLEAERATSAMLHTELLKLRAELSASNAARAAAGAQPMQAGELAELAEQARADAEARAVAAESDATAQQEVPYYAGDRARGVGGSSRVCMCVCVWGKECPGASS